jgi:hypothetical protein
MLPVLCPMSMVGVDLHLPSALVSHMEDKFRLSDRDVLIEVLDKYIYDICQLNCNQAAIDAHEALLARLEAGEPIE